MTTDGGAPIWDIAPHTAAKHQILSKYLGGWYPKLGLGDYGGGRVIYLDGFAGPGLYTNGSEGSPLIALRALMDHTSRQAIMARTEVVFIFNERDPKRYEILQEELENLRGQYAGWDPRMRVLDSCKDFDELADDILRELEGGGHKLAPTFAFVDPFGYKGISMEKLARLLAYPKCELFIYFDFNSVQRFATAGNVDEHFERLFGCDTFKAAPATGDPQRPGFLLGLYEEQLRSQAKFDYVQAFRMVNAKGKTNNYMIFCSRHLDGLDLMKAAMWSVDPTGEYTFSDRLAGQDILVGFDHVDPLKAALHARFAGQTVSIADVDRFVLTETPYHRGHIKRKTLGPMQRDGQLSTNHPRRGAFPDGCLITFAS